MAVLVRAPFLAVLGGLVAAMALYERTGLPAVVLLLAPALAAGLALCSFERDVRGQWGVLVMVSMVTLLCALRIFCALIRPEEPPRFIKVQGIITSVRPWQKNHVAVLETPEGGFLLRLHFATLTEGMRLSVEGVTKPLRPALRPGGFDEAYYWRARGVSSWLSPLDSQVLSGSDSKSNLKLKLLNLPELRFKLSRLLTIHMPPLTGAYLRAAWTGQRDAALNEAHRRWGTSHLLAVSGFHVGVVMLCASLLFPGRVPAWLLSMALWAYVLLTGAAPSSVRAGLMFQTAFLARVSGRPHCALNSVCLAAVLLLMYSPFLFWDIGWRLSVLAVLTLTMMYDNRKKRIPWAWALANPLISLVTFPQVAYTFHRFPAVGLFLNFAAPVFFSFGFILASIAAVLYFAGMPFASWLLTASEGGFVLWEWLADGMKALVPWNIPWTPFFAWLGAGTLFFLLCRFLEISKGRTVLLVTAGSLASFLFFV